MYQTRRCQWLVYCVYLQFYGKLGICFIIWILFIGDCYTMQVTMAIQLTPLYKTGSNETCIHYLFVIWTGHNTRFFQVNDLFANKGLGQTFCYVYVFIPLQDSFLIFHCTMAPNNVSARCKSAAPVLEWRWKHHVLRVICAPVLCMAYLHTAFFFRLLKSDCCQAFWK